MQISLAVVDKGAVASMTGVQAPVPWWSFTKTVITAAALTLVRDGQLAAQRCFRDRKILSARLAHRLVHRYITSALGSA